MLIKLDPAAINGRDSFTATPLIVAVASAAGRTNIQGLRDQRVLDFFLKNGADKALQDRDGLTAYGHFEKQRREYSIMMQAMMGQAVGSWAPTPSEQAV
jgi:hypothetical protein